MDMLDYIPIYRVSPELLVTNEHIISDSASTSSSSLLSGVSDFLLSLSSLSLLGSGEVRELCGVEALPSWPDVACEGDVGVDCIACEACLDCWFFSASFFSRVPRSVAPSSSPRRPRKNH